MFKKILGSLIRHGATAAGGALVAAGGDQTHKIAGLAVAAIGAIVSLVKAINEANRV